MAIAVIIICVIYVVVNKLQVGVEDVGLTLIVSSITGFLSSLTYWSRADEKYIKLKEDYVRQY